ncbi:hypothetical protein [Blastococcus tunisiensis]|uniref:Uncharacterized protein n=1 Tax=Blastococcus tunisiensis TaxID=1798228 RepID=A0A1I2M4N7_9ACTN|nr:hypothetical protein [Blastococcus sp. DSM 46838]SFF84346.1 hypothetical protein SAMN05216574_12914 [Blastococcus sp. DSM 46838]
MDDPHDWLFDPTAAHRLVLARRPSPGSGVVPDVVSDVVWSDVVRLLRWATADAGGLAEVESGRWWRLAAECGALLRRLPGLADELAEPWALDPATWGGAPADGRARVALTAARLTALLRSGEPVSLRRLAGEVDALGSAAIAALVEQAPWAAAP